MEMRVGLADSLYPGSSVGVSGPGDVSNQVADIAEWYLKKIRTMSKTSSLQELYFQRWIMAVL